LLVNIVIGNKLKALTSLDQKVRGWIPFFHITVRRHKTTGEKAGPNPLLLYKQNVVSPYSSLVESQLRGRLTGMRVKDCGESESLAVMAGTGIEPYKRHHST